MIIGSTVIGHQALGHLDAEAPSAAADLRFPEALSLGATGGCGWKTQIVVTNTGDEYRAVKWGRSLGRWVVGHNLRNAVDRAKLAAFHRFFQGTAAPFRFKDWTDFQVLSGQGTLVSYVGGLYLAKKYTLTDVFSSTHTVTRVIQHPVPGSVVFSPTGPTVDNDTGLVTGGTLGVHTWTGEFDVFARFDENLPDISEQLPGAGGWRGINLVEVREEI